MLYAKLEENHGLAKRAMAIYERAVDAVLPEERYDVIINDNKVQLDLNFIELNSCTTSTSSKWPR